MKQITEKQALPSINWREILWQEWQSCEDGEIADQLFELIADQLPGSKIRSALLIGLGMIYGVLVGLLMWLLTTVWATIWKSNPEIINGPVLFLFIGIGSIAGICGGLAARYSLLTTAAWPTLAFRFRDGLLQLGGEAVEPLEQVLLKRGPSENPVIVRILENIAAETHQQLAANASSLVCSNCFVRFQEHPIDRLGKTFYGCRKCKQSREFFNCPQGVTAVLDAGWTEVYGYQAGLLRVNWITDQKLFDLDRVEIIRATDKTVEHFAIQIGNDTDPIRQAHYKACDCTISADCKLSANSLRILQSFFGRVETR